VLILLYLLIIAATGKDCYFLGSWTQPR